MYLDVRDSHESEQGSISDSVELPLGQLASTVREMIPDRSTPVIAYCAVGKRSLTAAQQMASMGYTNVVNLEGGFEAWKDQGFPWDNTSGMSIDQLRRYSRHTVLPEVGVRGQKKLLASKVAIVGAGGLGSPVALYLAAAGVGTLGIIDDDVVELSNLQRQIMHRVGGVGEPKTNSAAQAIADLNTEVTVVQHSVRLNAANAREVLSGYDLIVDGTDNFPTRYLVNDVSLLLDVPVVHASIFRFEGQVAVFKSSGPCYRCLFPLPPPPELAPNCAEAGVLGVLPGIVGSLQAMEAIKVLLGVGKDLSGRLLLYDALAQDVAVLNVAKRGDCATCAPGASITLVDYDETCAIN